MPERENGVFGKFRNFTIVTFSGVAKIESRFMRGVPKVDGRAKEVWKAATEAWRPTRIWRAATGLSYPTYSEQIGRSVLNLHTSHITEEEQPALPLNRTPGPTSEQSSGPVLFTIPCGAVPDKERLRCSWGPYSLAPGIAGGRGYCRWCEFAAPGSANACLPRICLLAVHESIRQNVFIGTGGLYERRNAHSERD